LPEVNPEYEIYGVVLDSLFFGRSYPGQPAAQFIVIDSAGSRVTSDLATSDWTARQFQVHANEFAIAAAAFREAAPLRKQLDATMLRARAPVKLVPRSAISNEGLGKPGDYWQAFYDRYPGARGIIEFKRLAIDPTGRFALLDYGHGCGFLCGDYGYVLLEKRDGRWIILQRVIHTFI